MSTSGPASLGDLLRQFRRDAALSQDELADRSGVSARTISDLERGQRPSAHLETLRLLADALSLPPEDRTRLNRAAQSPGVDITLRRPASFSFERRGLPAAATNMIGRVREVAAIARAVASEANRLLTLTGPGGVGKTRLALAAAAAAAPAFPGGVVWVDLAPVRDPDAVMGAIAGGLGLDESDAAAVIAGLRTLCGDGRCVLVLDNFEQVIGAAPAIAALLAASPPLTVLVTSRAPLRLATEIEYSVTPLELPAPDATAREAANVESVRLFVDRARKARRDFVLGPETVEAVAQVCRCLDGLPLAIELAASRLNVLSLEALLERLAHRLPLLSRGPRDVPPRQQTMANTVAWSYNLLDPTAQRLFRLLSVFVGGFTLDTVETVLGGRASAGVGAVDALATLAENSLVCRVPASAARVRFTMYETIREFGIGQLREHQELQQAYGLLTSYCQGLTRFGDGIPNCIVPAPWLSIMDQERSNIRAAHQYLLQADNPNGLFAFTVAFGHYLYNRGPIQEAWAWFEQILDTSPSHPPTLRLQALYWASHLSSHLGFAERATELGNEALHLAEEFGDASWRAAIVHCLGLIQEGCGHLDQAAVLYEEELRLWEEAGVQGLSGFAFMLLGGIAFSRGDLVRARALEDQAAAIFYEMGGLGWVAMTYWYQGLFSASDSHLEDAAAYFAGSLQLSVEGQTSLIHHTGLTGLAFVASELALYDTAAHLIGAAETNIEEGGQRFSGYEQTLYDRARAKCRSVSPESFEAARQIGAGWKPSDWIRSGGVVKRAAAARRSAERAAEWPASEDAPRVLHSQPAAD